MVYKLSTESASAKVWGILLFLGTIIILPFWFLALGWSRRLKFGTTVCRILTLRGANGVIPDWILVIEMHHHARKFSVDFRVPIFDTNDAPDAEQLDDFLIEAKS